MNPYREPVREQEVVVSKRSVWPSYVGAALVIAITGGWSFAMPAVAPAMLLMGVMFAARIIRTNSAKMEVAYRARVDSYAEDLVRNFTR